MPLLSVYLHTFCAAAKLLAVGPSQRLRSNPLSVDGPGQERPQLMLGGLSLSGCTYRVISLSTRLSTLTHSNSAVYNQCMLTEQDSQSSESSFNLHRRRSSNGPVNCTKSRNGTCKTQDQAHNSSQNKYVDAALGSGCSDMLVSDIHHCDIHHCDILHH